MSLFTYNNLLDGTSIEASDVNGPFNDIATVINGNIDSTNITAASITTSKMVPSANIETWRSESSNSFIASGGVWSQSAALIGACTSGVAYYAGVRFTFDAVVSKNFTASKDTYVELRNDGQILYTEVANGAAPPAQTASCIPFAKVVTSGAAITLVQELCPRNPDEIARAAVLAGLTDTVTLPYIPARSFLDFKFIDVAAGGTLDTIFRFNNDSGANYAYIGGVDMAVGGSTVSGTSLPGEGGTTDSGGTCFATMSVSNYTAYEKHYQYRSNSQDAAGGGTDGSSYECFGKWANTAAQINRIDWINSGTGDFGVGTIIIVTGKN